MPTPSKFTSRTRTRVLQVLAAGGSRREAARAAGISHGTLGRWLERGKTGHPQGRWAEFRRAVEAAESEQRLVPLTDDAWTAAEAWSFLIRSGEFDQPEPDPPNSPLVI
jgi:hypothetical protein